MNIIDHFTGDGSMRKNNEDIWGNTKFSAWIFDGATGLADAPLVAEGGKTDARWLVECADAYLKTHADKIEDLHQLYSGVLAACESEFHTQAKRLPRAPWEMPMAASLIVKYMRGHLICGALSDCTLLIESADGDIDVMPACPKHAALDAVSHEKMREATARGLSAEDARHSILDHLQNTRRLANRKGGYDVFAPDHTIADRARITMFKPKTGGHALMMTDGFAALCETYGAYDHAGLIHAAAENGLHALSKELRQIENDDADLQKFPRTKKSDDATAVLIRF